MKFVTLAACVLLTIGAFPKFVWASNTSARANRSATPQPQNEWVSRVADAISFETLPKATISRMFGARERVGKDGCVLVAYEWMAYGAGLELAVVILDPSHYQDPHLTRNSFVVGRPLFSQLQYSATQFSNEPNKKTFSYRLKGLLSGENLDGDLSLTIEGSKYTIIDVYGHKSVCELE